MAPGLPGGKSSESKYFRFLPYLDFDRVGDHKVIWELNRHQHMVVLAQAWRLTNDTRYKNELFALLESWWLDNPVQRGINWASALEVAFRALSWTWVYHFTAADMPETFRGPFPDRAIPARTASGRELIGLFFAQYAPAR